MKKVFEIRAGYGKNENYIDTRFVVEDAIDVFKADVEKTIAVRGWDKNKINYRVWDTHDVVDEKGNDIIGAVTKDGWRLINVRHV